MISYDGRLYVEAEEHNISVLDNIILALKTYKSLLLGNCVGTAVKEILIVDNLGTDKATLKIAVYLSGSLRSLGSLGDSPGSCLCRTGSEIAYKSEKRVAGSYQLIKT